jgi:16S rRNA (guanine527-N7)-methyltransferase
MGAAAFGPEAFAERSGVSRETLARLIEYAAVLAKWQRAINLVSPAALRELWHRHLLDSAQLLPLLPAPAAPLLDIGSGAGFPGLVLAILGVPDVHLVESDTRKAAFLREAARLTVPDPAAVTVHPMRIEALQPFRVATITARACAPLPELLRLARPFLGPGVTCLFLKGARAGEELTAATKDWRMRVRRVASVTDPDGAVLKLDEMAYIPDDQPDGNHD